VAVFFFSLAVFLLFEGVLLTAAAGFFFKSLDRFDLRRALLLAWKIFFLLAWSKRLAARRYNFSSGLLRKFLMASRTLFLTIRLLFFRTLSCLIFLAADLVIGMIYVVY